MPQVSFKYLTNPKASVWTELRCGWCSRPGPSIETAAFPGAPNGGICVDCLRSGSGPRRDVGAARDRLKAALRAKNPSWGGIKADRIADERASELMRTPPIPLL